jgi:transposase
VDGTRGKAVRVDVTRDGFDAAHVYLRATFPTTPPEQMLIGVEFAGHNGFTFARFLTGRGYRVVSVLPFVTKRLKDIEDNSPQKDDAKDAAQICALVGQGLFVSFPLLTDHSAELRLLATERRRLSVEETRLKNRLHAALDLAWPEFTSYFADLKFDTPLALLERWTLPSELAQASVRVVHSVVKKASRNHIPLERVRGMIASAQTSIALEDGASARRADIRRLLLRWRLVRDHMAIVEDRLAELVAITPAATALTTVPGISIVCAATLVAEIGDPLNYESPRQILKLAGMNLVRRQSGTSMLGRVRQTKRGRPLLRRQLFLLAGRWCQRRGLYRAQYERMLRHGKSKTNAVCAIARKMVPMLLSVMQTAEPFDVERWYADRREQTAA